MRKIRGPETYTIRDTDFVWNSGGGVVDEIIIIMKRLKPEW